MDMDQLTMDQDRDINIWLGKDMDMGDVLLSQRRTKRRAQGLWRSGRRNIWERKTPTPSSSLLFSSWASPSFSFASPWLPSAIGPDPSVLSLSVSVPLFGRLNNLDVNFGVASEFGFQPLEPKIKAASKVAQIGDSPCLCLCSVWALQELSVGNNTCVYVSQDTSAVHNCSPMCTKEWTYFVNQIVKYGRRTSCFVFSSFSIITVDAGQGHRGGEGHPGFPNPQDALGRPCSAR